MKLSKNVATLIGRVTSTAVNRQPPFKVDSPAPAPNRLLKSPSKNAPTMRRYVK